MFGFTENNADKENPVSAHEKKEAVSKSDAENALKEELEESAVLKATVEFGCTVDKNVITCMEKREEPLGRILHAFKDAGKITADVMYQMQD